MKFAFVARFLVVFAVLTVLGAATQFPSSYASALEAIGNVTSPALSGWTFERDLTEVPRRQLRFRRGTESMIFQLSLEALALGLLPFLSLMGATPGMTLLERLRAISMGIAGLFVLDLIVLLAYPWMVRNPNAVKDITGTFLGLLTFVGGPVILWFALTYKHLRSVWNLGDGAVESD